MKKLVLLLTIPFILVSCSESNDLEIIDTPSLDTQNIEMDTETLVVPVIKEQPNY